MRHPRRFSTTNVLRDHEARVGLLERPRNTPWMYVEPIAPADTPDDYLAGYAAYAPFSGIWTNIAGREPTGFRIVEGRLQARVIVTGDEGTPGSLIFTLPTGFWPLKDTRLFCVAGDTGIGVIDMFAADGTVVFINAVSI